MNKPLKLKPEEIIEPDFREVLKEFTNARVAIGRTGCSLPTAETLNFSLDHARAKDAVHMPFDRNSLKQKLNKIGLKVIYVSSEAASRSEYLARPDLGRKLSAPGRKILIDLQLESFDIALVIGDGLSSKAVHKQAVPLIENLLPYLTQLKLSLAPVVLAEQARVALGDEIGEILKAKLVVMLIGERPGLSSPDSLGAYITLKPCIGRLDSERNCISNIRPEGLNYQRAAFKLAWLIEHAFSSGQTGINLKDHSDNFEGEEREVGSKE
jgi:ethanolamine ammonia-lyase small subunit